MATYFLGLDSSSSWSFSSSSSSQSSISRFRIDFDTVIAHRHTVVTIGGAVGREERSIQCGIGPPSCRCGSRLVPVAPELCTCFRSELVSALYCQKGGAERGWEKKGPRRWLLQQFGSVDRSGSLNLDWVERKAYRPIRGMSHFVSCERAGFAPNKENDFAGTGWLGTPELCLVWPESIHTGFDWNK